jgi:hypothetical protein
MTELGVAPQSGGILVVRHAGETGSRRQEASRCRELHLNGF